MAKIEVTITGSHGLHARPAAVFVQKAASFPCVIKVTKNAKTMDAKSIMGIMSMGIEQGETITISAEGDRADEALAALAEIAQNPDI